MMLIQKQKKKLQKGAFSLFFMRFCRILYESSLYIHIFATDSIAIITRTKQCPLQKKYSLRS